MEEREGTGLSDGRGGKNDPKNGEIQERVGSES